MPTAILSAESESDLKPVIELSKKLNLKIRVLENDDLEPELFLKANESALVEWLTPEEDEAWKNL